jgi:DNA-directed RNA polymerase subunit RPC12/RpoP
MRIEIIKCSCGQNIAVISPSNDKKVQCPNCEETIIFKTAEDSL